MSEVGPVSRFQYSSDSDLPAKIGLAFAQPHPNGNKDNQNESGHECNKRENQRTNTTHQDPSWRDLGGHALPAEQTRDIAEI